MNSFIIRWNHLVYKDTFVVVVFVSFVIDWKSLCRLLISYMCSSSMNFKAFGSIEQAFLAPFIEIYWHFLCVHQTWSFRTFNTLFVFFWFHCWCLRLFALIVDFLYVLSYVKLLKLSTPLRKCLWLFCSRFVNFFNVFIKCEGPKFSTLLLERFWFLCKVCVDYQLPKCMCSSNMKLYNFMVLLFKIYQTFLCLGVKF